MKIWYARWHAIHLSTHSRRFSSKNVHFSLVILSASGFNNFLFYWKRKRKKKQHTLDIGQIQLQKLWNHVRIWLRSNKPCLYNQYTEQTSARTHTASQNKSIDTRQKTQSHFWIIKNYCSTMTLLFAAMARDGYCDWLCCCCFCCRCTISSLFRYAFICCRNNCGFAWPKTKIIIIFEMFCFCW